MIHKIISVASVSSVSSVVNPPAFAACGSKIGICPRLENGGGRVAFLLDPWQLLELELK